MKTFDSSKVWESARASVMKAISVRSAQTISDASTRRKSLAALMMGRY